MSETSNSPTVEQLQSTLNNLAFIHRKLTFTQYLPEEFSDADKALRMVITMAEKIQQDIQSQSVQPEQSVGVENV